MQLKEFRKILDKLNIDKAYFATHIHNKSLLFGDSR